MTCHHAAGPFWEAPSGTRKNAGQRSPFPVAEGERHVFATGWGDGGKLFMTPAQPRPKKPPHTHTHTMEAEIKSKAGRIVGEKRESEWIAWMVDGGMARQRKRGEQVLSWAEPPIPSQRELTTPITLSESPQPGAFLNSRAPPGPRYTR